MRFQETKKPTGKTVERQVIHDVDIIDASGSMGIEKYSSAIKGVNSGIEDMRQDDSVDYTKTVIEFDSGHRGRHPLDFRLFQRSVDNVNIIDHYFMSHKSTVKSIVGIGSQGGTPLYQTIGETIERLLTQVKPTDKVLIKVFTDGGENSSTGKYSSGIVLKELMDKVQAENNFTITFIGTEFDVRTMVNNMGIARLNTLVHNNTAQGVQEAYKGINRARTSYSKSVADGEILASTVSFFKDINNEQNVK